MTEENDPQSRRDPHAFILENLATVPHLEALVLLWNSRPVGWVCEELALRLYLSADKVRAILQDLVRLQLLTKSTSTPPKYAYYARSNDQDEMMALVDAAYRRDVVRISTMLHSKGSPAVQDFAKAFRFKKERP